MWTESRSRCAGFRRARARLCVDEAAVQLPLFPKEPRPRVCAVQEGSRENGEVSAGERAEIAPFSDSEFTAISLFKLYTSTLTAFSLFKLHAYIICIRFILHSRSLPEVPYPPIIMHNFLVLTQSRGWNCSAIHGDMSQDARTRAFINFKDGKIPLLIATDVVSFYASTGQHMRRSG